MVRVTVLDTGTLAWKKDIVYLGAKELAEYVQKLHHERHPIAKHINTRVVSYRDANGNTLLRTEETYT